MTKYQKMEQKNNSKDIPKQKKGEVKKEPKVLFSPPTLKSASFYAVETKNETKNHGTSAVPKFLGSMTSQETLQKPLGVFGRLTSYYSANYKKYQLFSDEQAYAEGFGPDSKLVKFFKKPIPLKTAGIVCLLIAAGLVIFSGISIFPLFSQNPRATQTAMIKASQTQTIKTTVAVANGQPIQWTTLIKRSDITKGNYLLKLPKGATQIKITNITVKQAKAVLKTQPTQQLSLKQRQDIALATENKSKVNAGFLAKITSFLFADIGDAVSNVADTIAQPAPDSTVVDLSSQAPTSTTCAADSDCSSGQTCSNGSCVTPTPAPTTPATTPAPTSTTCAADSDCSSGQTCSNGSCVTPTPAPTTPATTPAPTSTTCAADSDCSSGQTCDNGSCTKATAPAPTPTPTPIALDTAALSADIATAQTLLSHAVVGTTTGDYAQSDVDLFQSAINAATTALNNTNAIQQDINSADANLNAAIATFKVAVQYVQVTYQTPAPVITEQNTDTGKLVTVSTTNEDPEHPLVDVLASTKIPKIFKVGEENKIHIKWKNNGNQNVTFTAYDTDNDGYLDYVEWTVPHLSDQIFEIIFISKAFQLDSNQNIVADIYSQVQTQDNVFATIPSQNYVRATFYQTLDNTKDITIYARATDSNTPVSINVFPVYTDSDGNQTEGPQIITVSDGTNPDFSNITSYQKYRILLRNFHQTPTDVFDLQVQGGSIDIDYIVDPTAPPGGDTFSTETYIGGSIGAEFLAATPAWTSTGWTGSWAAGWVHTTGNTSALSYPTAATSGAYYRINTVVSGTYGSGTATVTFGGQSETITQLGAPVWNILTTTTDNLVITPTSTFTGTILITIFPMQETTRVVGSNGTLPFGGITLAPCYAAVSGWVKCAAGVSVRDITGAYNNYVTKDIYCDGTGACTSTTDNGNCILYTSGATPTATECIATDTNVYANLLWKKADTSTSKTWANTANNSISISGGDIGGTHTTNTAGNNNQSIGGYNWLERNYTSTNGTAPYYPAMDACKALGLGWRLPNILELDSIRENASPYTHLPNITAGYYWSSSENSSSSAWNLYFGNGVANGSSGKSASYYVRCVRGY
ncbi:MAG: DUF1566 domain-containing protein [Candidatus Staskawiczbacteria bacterium]